MRYSAWDRDKDLNFWFLGYYKKCSVLKSTIIGTDTSKKTIALTQIFHLWSKKSIKTKTKTKAWL